MSWRNLCARPEGGWSGRIDLRAGRLVAILALVAALAGYYLLAQWIAPLPFYSMNYDPEMAYFMNSLALFKGAPYYYTDHPGTPVEVLGSLLLAATRPWTRSLGVLFVPYHLRNPQVFLTLAHTFLTAASTGCLVGLATRAVRQRGPAGAAASCAVAVSYFAAYPEQSFRTLALWSHNSFTFPAGTLLMLWLTLRLRDEQPLGPVTALTAGVLAGLLITVQLYFLAWGFGAVAAMGACAGLRGEGWMSAIKKAAWAALGVGLGFFIGFQPVLYRYREFYLWVRQLVLHRSLYGSGLSGVTSAGRLMENLEALSYQVPSIFRATAAILALVFLAMIVRRGRVGRQPGWWAACLALLLQAAVLFAAIGKHPGGHYLLAVAATLPLLFGLALETLLQAGGRWRILVGISSAVVLVAFAAGWRTAAVQHVRRATGIQIAEAAMDREIRAYSERSGLNPEEMIILWGYGAPSSCAALRFGDAYTRQSLQGEVNSICDNEFVYEVWGGYVRLPGAFEPLASNDDWDILIVAERYRPALAPEAAEIVDTGVDSDGHGNVLIVIRSSPPAIP